MGEFGERCRFDLFPVVPGSHVGKGEMAMCKCERAVPSSGVVCDPQLSDIWMCFLHGKWPRIVLLFRHFDMVILGNVLYSAVVFSQTMQ